MVALGGSEQEVGGGGRGGVRRGGRLL